MLNRNMFLYEKIKKAVRIESPCPVLRLEYNICNPHLLNRNRQGYLIFIISYVILVY